MAPTTATPDAPPSSGAAGGGAAEPVSRDLPPRLATLAWRPARLEDHPFVLQALIATARQPMRDGWHMTETAITRDLHRRCFQMPWRVVLQDGEPVGAVALERTGWLIGRTLWVQGIHVLPAHQGRGVGTALLARALADARRERRAVKLHVMVINTPARRLYERFGLRPIFRVGASYLMRLPADGVARPPLPRALRVLLRLPDPA